MNKSRNILLSHPFIFAPYILIDVSFTYRRLPYESTNMSSEYCLQTNKQVMVQQICSKFLLCI